VRVRISYGVEVEDVPNEAHELGTSVGTKLANALKTILPSALEELVSKDADYGLVSKKLDEFRRVLSDVDLTVADIDGIVRGLQDFHEEKKDVPDG
tara:strand:+ start:273 stop:560 length:288 start_codon:yes stop_codon:yes gene_type:complete